MAWREFLNSDKIKTSSLKSSFLQTEKNLLIKFQRIGNFSDLNFEKQFSFQKICACEEDDGKKCDS